MDGIVIPVDTLPKDVIYYANQAEICFAHFFSGLILVILHINIKCGGLFGYNMDQMVLILMEKMLNALESISHSLEMMERRS